MITVRSPLASTAQPAWHTLDAAELERVLDVDRVQGLSTDEAARRLGEHGGNELIEDAGRGALRLLWDQVRAVMVLILLAAATLSLLLGKLLEAGAIAAIVVLFVALGFVQEQRAERAIAALRRMSAPEVRVRRDGADTAVAATQLVPGDVVVLEAGNVVPADLRVVASASLRVQEAALTGESEPVDKTTGPDDGDTALADRRGMVFSGTQVVHGRGVGLVVATGMRTELGHIAALLGRVDDEATPLQRRLDRVGTQLAIAGVVVAALVVMMGALAGESVDELILTAIGVAVAVIPEGLPAVVTVTLAIGAQRMLRRQALVRRLSAVETLGSVTVICSDKTGTLTQNRMTVTIVDVLGDELDVVTSPTGAGAAARATLAAAVLCNDAELGDGEDADGALGDPTETALLVAATRVGLDVAELRRRAPRTAEVPFDSERKRMSTIHHDVDGAVDGALSRVPAGHVLVVVKGALDGLAPRLVGVQDGTDVVAVDADLRDRVIAAGDRHAAGGMRVLAVAYRTLPHDAGELRGPTDAIEHDLVLLGLVGMIDPPRPEVAAAVQRCAAAGIRPVMITGDHPLTAQAIGAQLGIGDGALAMTGAELDQLDAAGWSDAVERVSVFARVSPEHKLRLVGALKAQGHVVAMTGDGVNDAPALRRADIGVAMGVTGTDVSKEAAAMVLRDDNFSTIVAAVEEGRVIFDNLRRFVSFAVAGNLGKILVMLIWPIPLLLTGNTNEAVALLPLQLLWLNLMTDGLLGLAMGVERAERNVMHRPPNDPESGILSGGYGRQTALIGVAIGAIALVVGLTYHAADRPEWQTMVFTTLAFLQIGQALAARSSTEAVWRLGLRSNPTMAGVVAAVVGLTFVALYTPLNELLDVTALGIADLAVCVAGSLLLVVVIEADKARRRRLISPPTPEIVS
jgi:Ca2+-transporting ATPase